MAASGRACRFVSQVSLPHILVLATVFSAFYSYHFLARPAGSFRVGEYGTLLKRFCEGERECYLKLMEDALKPFVPAYHGVVQVDEQDYNMMDNLLTHFSTPAVMDCKMGSR